MDCCDAFQLLLYLSTLGLVITDLYFINYENQEAFWIYFAIGTYFLDLILSFTINKTFQYLQNIKTDIGLINYLKVLFETAPLIYHKVECYHFEIRYRTVTDSKGNTRTETYSEKVTTYTGSTNFNYISWRDLSGTFMIDDSFLRRRPKDAMLRLSLRFNLECAPDGTSDDLENSRNAFYAANSWRDTHCNVWDERVLPGREQYQLVMLGKEVPCFLGTGWFVFCSIFLLKPIFFIYFRLVTSTQKFSIEKIISSRVVLHSPEFVEKYSHLAPRLILPAETINFYDSEAMLQSINADVPEQIEYSDEVIRNSVKRTDSVGSFVGYDVVLEKQHQIQKEILAPMLTEDEMEKGLMRENSMVYLSNNYSGATKTNYGKNSEHLLEDKNKN